MVPNGLRTSLISRYPTVVAEGAGRKVAGRYLLQRQLGDGGMGRVWLARDVHLRRDVAVKEVLPSESWVGGVTDPVVGRTLREARAAANVRHRGVVTVYDAIDYADRPWIIMEYIDGQSLADRLRDEGPLPVRRAAEITIEVIDALDAAHRQGVLHRDVKPGNIMLDKDRVVLTDFGIAAIDGATMLTTCGQLIGSPEFIAPERIDGHEATPATDLWAVGITLYHMVTGDTPFRRTDTLGTFAAIARDEPEPHQGTGPLWPVIQGLLRKDHAERLTAAAAAAQLREVLAQSAAPPSAVPKTPMALAPTRPENTTPDLTARNTRIHVSPLPPPTDTTEHLVVPIRRPSPRTPRTGLYVGVAGLIVAAVAAMVTVVANLGTGDASLIFPIPEGAPAITITRDASTSSDLCLVPHCAYLDVALTGFAPNTRYLLIMRSAPNFDIRTEYVTTDSIGAAEYHLTVYGLAGETVWMSIPESTGTVSSNTIVWK